MARLPSVLAVLICCFLLGSEILSLARVEKSIISHVYTSAIGLIPESFSEREEEIVDPRDDPTQFPVSDLASSGDAELHFLRGRDMVGGPDGQAPIYVDLACVVVPDADTKACFELEFKYSGRDCVFDLRNSAALPEREIVASYGSIGVKSARPSIGRKISYEIVENEHLRVTECSRTPRHYLIDDFFIMAEKDGAMLAILAMIAFIMVAISLPIVSIVGIFIGLERAIKWTIELGRHFR